MRKRIFTLTAGVACLGTLFAQTVNLPVTVKDGQPYYQYTPEKDESVFGILQKFGWDEDTFRAANPGLTELKKNTILYYPASEQTRSAEQAAEVVQNQTVREMTTAEVDKLLSQSKQEDEVPTAETQEPEADSVPMPEPQQIAIGVVVIPENELLLTPSENITIASEPIIVISKEGDTLESLAREYHTTVADLFDLNPRLSYTGIPGKTLLKVTPGFETKFIQQRTVTERIRKGKRKIKIEDGDTWESIAAAQGTTVEELKELNKDVTTLKKNKSLEVPKYEELTTTKDMLVLDKREQTPAGLKEIYNEVHPAKTNLPADVNVAVLVNVSPDERKRSVEFLRGFMLGLETLRKTPYKVHLKVVEIDSDSNLSTIVTENQLDAVDMIISTTDKDFPQELISVGENNNIQIINVFDPKGTNYADNSRYMQVLPPSDYLYGQTASLLTREMAGRTYIFIGEDNYDSESISGALRDLVSADAIVRLDNLEMLASYPFNPQGAYVVISDESSRQPVMELIDTVTKLKEANPNMVMSVVGRPTWLVFSDANAAALKNADTYFPTRFYLDESDEAVKAFEKRFGGYYKAHSLKSLPGYAAMGHDVAKYFIDSFATTGGDVNLARPSTDMLQLDFDMSASNAWGGLFNHNVYLLHYGSAGVNKIQP